MAHLDPPAHGMGELDALGARLFGRDGVRAASIERTAYRHELGLVGREEQHAGEAAMSGTGAGAESVEVDDPARRRTSCHDEIGGVRELEHVELAGLKCALDRL